MIESVDASLEAWLHQVLPKGTGVSFEPPTAHWLEEERDAPLLNAFLCEVRLEGMADGMFNVRDPEQKVAARQPPPVLFRFSYLMSAWAANTTAEHTLLGLTLQAVASQRAIPVSCLRGVLAQAPGAALPLFPAPEVAPGATANPVDALRLPPRTYLHVVVLAPVLGAAVTDLATAPRRTDLGVAGGSTSHPPAPQNEPVRERGRISEAGPSGESR